MKKLILFGCGNQAKNIFNILNEEGVVVDGFCVDAEYHESDYYLDKPLHKTEDFFSRCSVDEYIVFLPLSAKKRCEFRKNKFLQFAERGYEFYTFISKRAFLYPPNNIGKNVYIEAGAMFHPDVTIGDNCYISGFTGIGHDSTIGAHSFIGPSVILCGNCEIGECVTIGASAVVRDNLRVAAGAVLGMGISVHHNIDKADVYVYSPLEEEHFVCKNPK